MVTWSRILYSMEITVGSSRIPPLSYARFTGSTGIGSFTNKDGKTDVCVTNQLLTRVCDIRYRDNTLDIVTGLTSLNKLSSAVTSAFTVGIRSSFTNKTSTENANFITSAYAKYHPVFLKDNTPLFSYLEAYRCQWPAGKNPNITAQGTLILTDFRFLHI